MPPPPISSYAVLSCFIPSHLSLMYHLATNRLVSSDKIPSVHCLPTHLPTYMMLPGKNWIDIFNYIKQRTAKEIAIDLGKNIINMHWLEKANNAEESKTYDQNQRDLTKTNPSLSFYSNCWREWWDVDRQHDYQVSKLLQSNRDHAFIDDGKTQENYLNAGGFPLKPIGFHVFTGYLRIDIWRVHAMLSVWNLASLYTPTPSNPFSPSSFLGCMV